MLASLAERALSEKLGCDVRIGDVEVGLFNRVSLRDVSLNDRERRRLLDARLMSCKIELLPLLRGEVSLRTVSLLDGNINAYKKTKDGPTNFQFVIDAFKSKQPRAESRLDLRLNSLILRRCQLAYDAWEAPCTPGQVNLNHLAVEGLDASISLKKLTPDSINLRVRRLAFREQSGLSVKRLTFRLAANRRQGQVSKFALELPDSKIEKNELMARYDARRGGNAFFKSLVLTGRLAGACISTDDIACIVPKLRHLHRRINVSAALKVVPHQISLRQLELQTEQGDFRLEADAVMQREEGAVTAVSATVRRLEAHASVLDATAISLSGKPLPKVLKNVGDVAFSGGLRYDRDGESTLNGQLKTGLGNISASLRGRKKALRGIVEANRLSVAPLFEKKTPLRSVSFRLEADADLTRKQAPVVHAALNLKKMETDGYAYSDMLVSGSLKQQAFRLEAVSRDPALRLRLVAGGRYDGKRLSLEQVAGNVEKCQPSVLRWTERFGKASFSFAVSARLKSLNRQHPEGRLDVTDFRMQSTGDDYRLRRLSVALAPSENGSRVSLGSDFAAAELDGLLSLDDVAECGKAVLMRCLPGLDVGPLRGGTGRAWKFMARVYNTDFFNRVLNVPLHFDGTASVDGNIRADGGHMSVAAHVAAMRYAQTELRGLSFYLRGDGSDISCLAQGEKTMSGSDVRFVLSAAAQGGRLRTDFSWEDRTKQRYAGRLSAQTTFEKDENGKQRVLTEMIPTEVAVGDSVWNVSSGRFSWRKDEMEIQKFRLSHENQALTLDGRLSRNTEDSIVATLQRMDIDYILSLVDLQPVHFSGLATGQAILSHSIKSPRLSTRLLVDDFRFNGGYMGTADIAGHWNSEDGKINLEADMQEPGGNGTKVKGYVSVADKNLDLSIASRGTDLYFLRRYVDGIFENLEGRATGTCRLYGPFKALDFEGKETVDMTTKIPVTGAVYSVKGGTVDISPGCFAFKNVHLTDRGGGTAELQGTLRHTHLKNLTYEINATANRLLLYDKPKELDMPFYATAYGTGSVRMSGHPGEFSADIVIRPERGTTFTYSVDSPDAFGDVDLLTFHDAADTLRHVAAVGEDAKEETAATTGIRLNFLLDITPAASIKVITNEKSDDYLQVRGAGPIRASFYNKGNFSMFGTYVVEDGVYKMSIQDVIRKDFELTKGSRLTFSGDPYEGDLDLQAVYVVNSASLSDLNIGSNFSESSVRVNCILNLKGKVHSPEVSFDLDLPTVNEDEKQMVRNIISTEEDMNMQILYLLGVGRFYTYDYGNSSTASSQPQSSVAVKSFLSNTLSGQLNDIISNAIGSSNWRFGANLSTGDVGWSDMEVEGLLSGRLLNNRLLINGNFGYRDRQTNSTNFVGDFDIRYLLTPGGGISLKAYSETNDRYFTKSSLTTQGGGIMLTRDFSNLKDLFKPGKKRKKNKKETKIPEK